MSNVIWPEVFTSPAFEYQGEDNEKRDIALADGLVGWALCMSGNRPPSEQFGYGMIKIGNILGVAATLDNLMKLSEEIRRKEVMPDASR